MKNKIDRIFESSQQDTLLIYNPFHIKYFTKLYFDVQERFITLILHRNKEPQLLINKLFKNSFPLDVIYYQDHENPLTYLKQIIRKDKNIGVDGDFPLRFILPLIQEGYQLIDISSDLETIRSKKSKDEYKKLKKASKLNDQIMKEISNFLKIGVSEKEVQEKIKKLQNRQPLSGVSFEPIVLFSENMANPHGNSSSRTLKKNDAVLIDMGGYYQGYASDMTRCFQIGHNPYFEKIYSIVLKSYEAAIKAIKIGTSFKAIDQAARSIIEEHGYGQYFTHRTGHGIGLQVHEKPDVSNANKEIIEEGMCFSIEPGIYLPGKIGIRIESLVFVHKTYVEVLNTSPDIAKNCKL